MGYDVYHFSALKTDEASATECLVSSYQATRRHIPEYNNFEGHSNVDLNSQLIINLVNEELIKGLIT
jgi:hypothetical protein